MQVACNDLCPGMEIEWGKVVFLLSLFHLCEVYINPVSKPQVWELNLFKIPEKEDVIRSSRELGYL